MRTRYAVAFAVITGFGLGAVSVEGLRAQAKPPVYVVAEVDVRDVEPYTKEYAPKVSDSRVSLFSGRPSDFFRTFSRMSVSRAAASSGA